MFSKNMFKVQCQSFLLRIVNTQKSKRGLVYLYSTMPCSEAPEELCKVVSSTIGGLDDLESNLSKFTGSLSSSLVAQVIDFCKNEAPSRRLLRFFLWSRKNLKDRLEDKDYNHAIRVFAEKKDHTAIDILVSDLRKDGRVMESQSFGALAEALVKLGREDEALGIFKNLEKFKCEQDSITVTAIVTALCAKGHVKRAEAVVRHHKDKISGVELCIYKDLLYGWSRQENVKEMRKIIKEMKGNEFTPDLFCYNTFLRGLCERNVRHNPSGLVPEALNIMMEMRSYRIAPDTISYNILLSCLGRTRRVKESCRIFQSMKKSGCAPDWTSYYLVARVLYLSGRFGKGNQIVDEMSEEGIVPDCKFYHDLIGILCGVEKVNLALELFERMKRSLVGGYGPVYDVLVPKLCRGGEFEKGRELWDEATAMGVSLRCSQDILDPSVTELFKPSRKLEEVCVVDNNKTLKAKARAKKMFRVSKNKKANHQNKKTKSRLQCNR